jgi:hypothetical protein
MESVDRAELLRVSRKVQKGGGGEKSVDVIKTTPENSSKNQQMVPRTGCDRCGLSALRSAVLP